MTMSCGILLFSLTLLCMFHVSSSLSMRKLKQSIDIVEARQVLESKIRQADIESVFESLENLEAKIDNISGKVEETGEQSASSVMEGNGETDTESINRISENVKSLKYGFLRLLKAFREEKEQNADSGKLLDGINDKYSIERIIQEVTDSMKSVLYKEVDKLKQEIYSNLSAQLKEKEKANTAVTKGPDHEIEDKSITELEKTPDRYKSCLELLQKGGKSKSGIYNIHPNGLKPSIRVFCDQESDGGGWTVIQRRKDGSVDFYRSWGDYKVGFGNLDGEFWLGNDYLSVLTSKGNHDLRIDLVNWKDDEKCTAAFKGFSIGPETTNYTLTISAFTGGSCGDALTYHNGMQFSTNDRDNDRNPTNCAQVYTGAWWYNSCSYSDLNGVYGNSLSDDGSGVFWYNFNTYSISYSKFSEMKIRQH